MIRLLRRKRALGFSPDGTVGQFPTDGIDFIDPKPPAQNGHAVEMTEEAGAPEEAAYFEPSLDSGDLKENDASESDGEIGGWPHFTIDRPMADETDPAETIQLDVHGSSDEERQKSDMTEDDRDEVGPDAAAPAAAKAADSAEPAPKGTLLQTVPLRETRLAKVEEEPASNPSFNIFANARIWRHDERNLNYSGEVAKLYRDVFTPTRPKRNYRDFSGRRDIIENIIQAVEEERSHVILLGEKSLGKTSLLNIVQDCATEAGYLVARMTGTADMSFRHFILAILEQFSARIAESPVHDILQKRLGTDDLSSLVDPDKELDVPAAIKIFQRLTEHQAIVLIDDFDRIGNEELKFRIGELMSVLSDQGAWLSLLLFGRAARASEILPESYQTLPNVTWIKMQPMHEEDAAQVIARGVSAVGVQFNDDVTDNIIRLSQGLPSAIQWLCLLSIRNATQRYASEVEMHDLAEVVDAASGKIDAKLSSVYDQLCGPARGNWADDILYLAVQASADRNGVFSADSMSRISQDAIGRRLLELPLHSALSRFTSEDEEDAVL
ncbi:MAG: ATP-binding protein, partial [Pseudomonadota bacterium]